MFYLENININDFSINPDTWVDLDFRGIADKQFMEWYNNKDREMLKFDLYTIGNIIRKEPHFGGAWYNREGNLIAIKEVKYNNPVTVVFWSDGTKTTSKCQKGDIYSKETGLTICVLKKLKNNNWFQKLINDWVPTDDKTTQVTLKDLRKKERGPHYAD